jgi:hypothetical protein
MIALPGPNDAEAGPLPHVIFRETAACWFGDMIRQKASQGGCPMTTRKLDGMLDCKRCGTIQMTIPENATDDTPVHCSNCGGFLGTWGELQEDFAKQIGNAESVDLDHGTMTKNS